LQSCDYEDEIKSFEIVRSEADESQEQKKGSEIEEGHCFVDRLWHTLASTRLSRECSGVHSALP
jgi:hypothetical protein